MRAITSLDGSGLLFVKLPRTHRPAAALAAVTALTVVAVGAFAGSATANPSSGPSRHDIAASRQHANQLVGQVGALQGQIAAADAKLARLQISVETAVEAFNAARIQLDAARTSSRLARANAARAMATYGTAQDSVDAYASAAYMSGAPDSLTLIASNGPSDLLERVATLDVLSRNQAQVLDNAHASRIVADVLQRQADAALSTQQKAASKLRSARDAAAAAVADQQSTLRSLAQMRGQLVRRLGAARAHTAELTAQRKSALAEAARQARQQAQQSDSSPSTSSGGNSGSSGSTGPTPAPPGSSQGSSDGAAAAIAFARAQLGKPYVWGASGPDSYDCSGLTMAAWAAGGVTLPHYTVAQYAQVQKVSASQAQPGDLVFWASDPNDFNTIYHVALYIGGGQVIEAPHTGANVQIAPVYSTNLYGYGRP